MVLSAVLLFRLMRIALACVFTVAAMVSSAADERGAVDARHRQLWVTWSNKTGLSVETIERLWHATMGIYDVEDDFGLANIEIVDAQTFKPRKRVLFVVSDGNGHCLSLYIFGNSGRDKKPLWQLEDGGFCHEQMLGYATAYARPPGDIVVQVPTGPAWITRKNPDSTYPVSTALTLFNYRRNGTTYMSIARSA